MKEEEIRYLGDLQRLTIKPGDKFVLTADRPISREMAAALKSMWEGFAGPDIPLLILDKGCSLGAISVVPEDPEFDAEMEATRESIGKGARTSDHRFRA